MNPARSLGIAPFTGWENHWVRIFPIDLFTSFIPNDKAVLRLDPKKYITYGFNYFFKVYWIGPILGGVFAALTYVLLFKADPPSHKPVATKENQIA